MFNVLITKITCRPIVSPPTLVCYCRFATDFNAHFVISYQNIWKCIPPNIENQLQFIDKFEMLKPTIIFLLIIEKYVHNYYYIYCIDRHVFCDTLVNFQLLWKEKYYRCCHWSMTIWPSHLLHLNSKMYIYILS